jgi:hypothetical protein
VTKGLYKGAKTGLRIGWQKAGKPTESLFVHMPFRDEAADLVTSLWQQGRRASPARLSHALICLWSVLRTASE